MSANEDVERARLVLVTGASGSGKSTAAKALEDVGYYTIDNLPLPLLRTFLSDPVAQVGGQRKIAVVTDVRAHGFAEQMPKILAAVDRGLYDFVLLFLDASRESLLRRFFRNPPQPSARGRRSPGDRGHPRERELLAVVRGAADLVFDTSDWSVHDVRRAIYREFGSELRGAPKMVVSLVSFGFKHGIPSGSDLVFDVRFLANPHFLPALRELSGCDRPVLDFLDAERDFADLLARLEELFLFLLPRYRLENRSYLTIAIGCTGGRHRSVATCERLSRRLEANGWTVRLHHRDLER
ncbi:MAG: RNase adapter RapZ [Thermoanaerobaculia bacterium]|nr:RNase adapter RapZ [Thermoanaerobaculia bacterium]